MGAHRRLWAVLITICTILGVVFFAAGLGLAVLAGKGVAVNSGTEPKGTLSIVRKVPAMDINVGDRILVPDATIDAWDAAEVVATTPTANSKAIYTLIPVADQGVNVPGNYMSRWTDLVLWSAPGMGALTLLFNSPVLIGLGLVLLALSVWGIYSLRRRPSKRKLSAQAVAEPALSQAAPSQQAVSQSADSQPAVSQPVVPELPALVDVEPLALPIGVEAATAAAPIVAASDMFREPAALRPDARAEAEPPSQVAQEPHEAHGPRFDPVTQGPAFPAIPLNPVNRNAGHWLPEGYLTPSERSDGMVDQPAAHVEVHEPARPAYAMPTEVPDELMWDTVLPDAGPRVDAVPEVDAGGDMTSSPYAAGADAVWPTPAPMLDETYGWRVPEEIPDPQVTWGTGEIEAVDPHVTWTAAGTGVSAGASTGAHEPVQQQPVQQPMHQQMPAVPEEVSRVSWTDGPVLEWPGVPEVPLAPISAAWVPTDESDGYTWAPTEESLLAAEAGQVPVDPYLPAPSIAEPAPSMAVPASAQEPAQQRGREFAHTVCEHVGIAWPIKAGLRAAGLAGPLGSRVVPIYAQAPGRTVHEPMFAARQGAHAAAAAAAAAAASAAAPAASTPGYLQDLEPLPSRRSLRQRVA